MPDTNHQNAEVNLKQDKPRQLSREVVDALYAKVLDSSTALERRYITNSLSIRDIDALSHDGMIDISKLLATVGAKLHITPDEVAAEVGTHLSLRVQDMMRKLPITNDAERHAQR